MTRKKMEHDNMTKFRKYDTGEKEKEKNDHKE